MSKHFFQIQAVMNVIRYEEVHHLFQMVYAMEKNVEKNQDHSPFIHKSGDRELTHDEVYRRALDDVMNLMDERMGKLSS